MLAGAILEVITLSGKVPVVADAAAYRRPRLMGTMATEQTRRGRRGMNGRKTSMPRYLLLPPFQIRYAGSRQIRRARIFDEV